MGPGIVSLKIRPSPKRHVTNLGMLICTTGYLKQQKWKKRFVSTSEIHVLDVVGDVLQQRLVEEIQCKGSRQGEDKRSEVIKLLKTDVKRLKTDILVKEETEAFLALQLGDRGLPCTPCTL